MPWQTDPNAPAPVVSAPTLPPPPSPEARGAPIYDASTGSWLDATTGQPVAAPSPKLPTASWADIVGGTLTPSTTNWADVAYDPTRGGWIYKESGQPAPAPTTPGAGFGPIGPAPTGLDVNGNAIPISAYQAPSDSSVLGNVGDALGGAASGLGGGVQSVLGGLKGLLGGNAPPIDTGAITTASQRATDLSAQYEAERRAYQPLEAPTAQATAIDGTALAQQQDAIRAGRATAGNIGPTVLASPQAAIAAQQLAAAQQGRTTLGPTALAGQTQLGPTSLADRSQLAQTALANAATIDPTQQAQFRTGQQGLISGLQGAINGTDPSVAAIMLRQATDRNIANQYALAQSANGQNAGLAQRQAMIGAADLNQQSIGQQALLRAQEIATARGQLGSVLDSGRGQDIGLAGQQAGLQQQTNLANQGAVNTASATQLGADVQTKLANAGFLNTSTMTQAQLNQATALANAGFKNTATTTQAQLDAAQGALNTQAQNDIAKANQGAALQAGTTNATLAQQVALANAAAGNTTNQQQAQLGTQASIANAGNVTSANTASSQLANQVALANAAETNKTNSTNAQLANQTSIANAGNATTTNAQNITAQNDLAQNALTGSGQAITGAVGAADAQAKAQQAANTQTGAELGAITTIGAALLKPTPTLSDRRAKTDIRPGDLDVAAFLKDLKAEGWRYKDPTEPGAAAGEHFGPMAQDLEKSRVGRTLVKDDPSGRKMVDSSRAAMVALAALASLNKRVSAVEAR